MEINLSALLANAESEITSSTWGTLLANWSAEMSNLLNNPSLQENIWGQIEALGPLAAHSGSTDFANLFIVFTKQYEAFMANPSQQTLATITTEINTKLIPAAPLNPFNTDKWLADDTCELLLYKINPYNPDINQDEISGMLAIIQLFTPQTYQFQVQQLDRDYANYVRTKDISFLLNAQTDINALIGMLQT